MDELDGRLWDNLREDGSERAFTEFFEATRRYVWTICRRVLWEEEDARDAFQSTYVRLLAAARAGDDWRGEEPTLRAYVVRTAGREADALRKRKTRRGRKEVAMERLNEPESPARSPSEEAHRRQLRETLIALIAQLPDRYRTPVTLYYLDGLTQADIARALGRKEETIAKQIERGLKKLAPMVRRAGLGDARTALGLAAGSGLMAVPEHMALGAGAVFGNAQAALSASAGAAAGTAGSGSWTGKLMMETMLMKSKSMVVGGVVLLLVTAVALKHGGSPDAGPPAQSQLTNESTVEAPETERPATIDMAETDEADPGDESAKQTIRDGASTSPGRQATDSADGPTRPEGPTHPLTVAAVWADTQEPAEGVRMMGMREGAGDGEWHEVKTTDAKGLAQLELPESWSQVKVTAWRKDAQRPEPRRAAIPTGEVLAFFLERGALLEGVVLEARSREPVEGAEIRMTHAEGREHARTVESRADGSFDLESLPPGEVFLVAQKGALRSDLEGPTKAVLATGGESEKVVLELEEGRSITGRVTDVETGAPIVGAEVSSRGAPEDGVTDANGYYRISGLDEGDIDVRAQHSQYADGFDTAVVSGNGEHKLDFELAASWKAIILVLDQDEAPVAGVKVSAALRPSIYYDLGRTDGQGRMTSTKLSKAGIPQLSAEKEGYLRDSESEMGEPTLDAATGTAEITLRIRKVETAKAVTGRVTGDDGEPIEGAEVRWARTRGWIQKMSATQTDADGRYLLEFEYEHDAIHLGASAVGWAPQLKESVAVGVQGEPAVIDFVLEAEHWLAGKVIDDAGKPVEGVLLRVAPHADNVSMVAHTMPNLAGERRSGADGEFRIEGIAGSPVEVLLNKEGWDHHEEQNVEVDREITFTMTRPCVILGRVIDGEIGEAVTDFRIKLRSSGYSTDWSNPGLRISHAKGEFELEGSASSVRTGVNLTIEAEDYASCSIAQFPVQAVGDAEPIEIELERGGPLGGIVVDGQSGDPIAGAQVVIMRPEALGQMGSYVDWDRIMASLEVQRMDMFELPDWQMVETGEDGRFHFEREAGATIYIRAEGFEDMRVVPEERGRYQVGPGELRIALRPGLILSGVVAPIADPPTGALIQLAPLRGWGRVEGNLDSSWAVRGGENNAFEFKALSPGTYVLSAGLYQPPSQGERLLRISRRVEVKAGEENRVVFGNDLGWLVFVGRIVNSEGEAPKDNSQVRLIPQFDWHYTEFACRSYGSQSNQPELAGEFEIWGLRPGTYEMLVLPGTTGPPIPAGTIQINGNLDQEIRVDFQR